MSKKRQRINKWGNSGEEQKNSQMRDEVQKGSELSCDLKVAGKEETQ